MGTQVATLERTQTPRTYAAIPRMGPRDRVRGRLLGQCTTVMEVRVGREEEGREEWEVRKERKEGK